MSVIVRKLASPTMEVFVKGAPEVMKDICTPESSKGSFFLFIALCIFITLLTYIFFFLQVPEDYQERLYKYTHRGYRVIACASRQLAGVKWHKLHKLKRYTFYIYLNDYIYIILTLYKSYLEMK